MDCECVGIETNEDAEHWEFPTLVTILLRINTLIPRRATTDVKVLLLGILIIILSDTVI